jgi:F-type H+-transporting ATPase subunit epsilon
MAEQARLPEKLLLQVVTRERKVIDEMVDEVVVRAERGYMGILPGHTPLLAGLRVGQLMYRIGSEAHQLALSWGFAEVLPDRVIVLAEGAYSRNEIDPQAAERERQEAERELAQLSSHEPEFALAEARLEESIAKIDLYRRIG